MLFIRDHSPVCSAIKILKDFFSFSFFTKKATEGRKLAGGGGWLGGCGGRWDEGLGWGWQPLARDDRMCGDSGVKLPIIAHLRNGSF